MLLPGLHLKSVGSCAQTPSLQSQRCFTGQLRHVSLRCRIGVTGRENFAARTRTPQHEVTSHASAKHSQLLCNPRENCELCRFWGCIPNFASGRRPRIGSFYTRSMAPALVRARLPLLFDLRGHISPSRRSIGLTILEQLILYCSPGDQPCDAPHMSHRDKRANRRQSALPRRSRKPSRGSRNLESPVHLLAPRSWTPSLSC